MYLASCLLCCRMAKQKRKVTEVTEKKKKKLKKASAKENLLAPEATPGTKQVHPEVGARGVVAASPRFFARRGGSWGLDCWCLSGRNRGWNKGRVDTLGAF